MTDVFISYAREDRKFVQRLHDALANEGRESWVDWEGIPASAKWMAEVRAAIDEADCFCFVVSPDSVESPVCREEAAHAAASNKRILPLLHRQVPDGLVPQTVATHNWIEFDEQADFDRSFATLVKALETEPEHLRTHTRLLVRAKEWEGAERSRSSLLRGQDLTQAEAWLGTSQGKEPSPTQLHTSYVLASRKAASRRQRTVVGAVAIALVLSLVLSAVAVIQRAEAVEAQARAEEQRAVANEQRAAAEEQARIANSRALAAAALSHLDTQLDLGVLLALEALETADTPEAQQVLEIAVQRSLRMDRVVRSHEGSVNGVAFAPDGSFVATVSDDDSLLLTDPVSGDVKDSLTGIGEDPLDVAVSPDGRFVAAGDKEGHVIIWNTTSVDGAVSTLEGHRGWTYDVAFSPDGTLVSAGSEGTLRLWDPETARPIGDPLPSARWSTVAFSPDGGLLASVGLDGAFVLRETEGGRATGAPISCVERPLQGLDFSPDGQTLAAGAYDGSVWLVHLGGDPECVRLRGHSDVVFRVAFSPDGAMLASASADGTVQLWDVETGARIGAPLGGHTDAVFVVAFSPDGAQLASGSHDGTLVLWDLSLLPLRGHTGPVYSVTYRPDGGEILTSGRDGDIRRWDTSTHDANGLPLHGPSNVWAIAVSPDGSLVASANGDGAVRIWDIDLGRQIVPPMHGHTQPVSGIAFSPDGRLVASASDDETVRLWEVETGRPVGEPLVGHSDAVYTVAFSPDGTVLASGSDDSSVRLWDVATGQPLGEPLEGHADIVFSVAFSPDGRLLASGSKDGSIILWDVETRTPVGEPIVQRGWVNGVAFSPDGSILVSASHLRTLNFWDVASGRQLGEPVPGHTDWVNSVAFSPDNSKVVSASQDGTLIVWPSIAWNVGLESVREKLCAIAGRDLTQDEWQEFIPFREFRPTCSGT